MSFTQEKETNINRCDGCDKHCKLGFHHFTALGGKGTEPLCCPTIDGQPIKRYKGKNGEIIDATQNGDVCAGSGVPYYTGMEDINISEKMAATLVFKVGGVNWKVIK